MNLATLENFTTVNELKTKTVAVLKLAKKLKDPILVIEKNKPQVAILDYESFLTWVDALGEKIDSVFAQKFEAAFEKKLPSEKDFLPEEKIAKKYGIEF